MSASSEAQQNIFIGPGLSLYKRVVTGAGVLIIAAIVILIAVREGVPAIGSTIVALLFVGGFVYYLRIIAPVPFTIEIGPESLIKRNRGGEVIDIPWERVTRIKEEFFPNGKRIGIIVYRNPTTPQEKTKAWAVYRDDVTDIDALAAALQQALPETAQWQSETVHE
jgi:hypothetical protein